MDIAEAVGGILEALGLDRGYGITIPKDGDRAAKPGGSHEPLIGRHGAGKGLYEIEPQERHERDQGGKAQGNPEKPLLHRSKAWAPRSGRSRVQAGGPDKSRSHFVVRCTNTTCVIITQLILMRHRKVPMPHSLDRDPLVVL